jgi:hypothetical protein
VHAVAARRACDHVDRAIWLAIDGSLMALSAARRIALLRITESVESPSKGG